MYAKSLVICGKARFGYLTRDRGETSFGHLTRDRVVSLIEFFFSCKKKTRESGIVHSAPADLFFVTNNPILRQQPGDNSSIVTFTHSFIFVRSSSTTSHHHHEQQKRSSIGLRNKL